jgi:luciferase-like monooxygenase/integrase-like protein
MVHALRHTFATRLAEDGASASEIQALLGHESLNTSQGSIDATANATRQAARANRTYRALERITRAEKTSTEPVEHRRFFTVHRRNWGGADPWNSVAPTGRRRQNASVARLRDHVDRRLRAIDGVEQGESPFGSGAGYWVGGKEILHFDADDAVDVRLTRAEIGRRRSELRADDRIQLRPSSSADWIEVRLGTVADVELVVELARIAAAAHRPPPGRTSPPPPTGPDLERRRRFH